MTASKSSGFLRTWGSALQSVGLGAATFVPGAGRVPNAIAFGKDLVDAGVTGIVEPLTRARAGDVPELIEMLATDRAYDARAEIETVGPTALPALVDALERGGSATWFYGVCIMDILRYNSTAADRQAFAASHGARLRGLLTNDESGGERAAQARSILSHLDESRAR